MAAGEVWTRRVIGTGSAEKLIAVGLTFAEPAHEILEWRKTIDIERADVESGGVLLYGYLRTRCILAARDGDAEAPGIPEAGICRVREMWGRVLHHGTDVEFVIRIPVPGAKAGMEAAVTEACVVAHDAVPNRERRTGRITGVFDRSLINLCVRVSERVFAHIHSRAQIKKRKRSPTPSGPEPFCRPVP